MNTKIVPLQQVKELRERTLLGVKDCKRALITAKGDMETAENLLKKEGRLKANTRIKRKNGEGAAFVYRDRNRYAMLIQTCETESVAMNEIFRSTGAELAATVAHSGSAVITDEMTDRLKDTMAIFKENMNLRDLVFWNLEDREVVGEYIHNDGQIAVAVKLACGNKSIGENPAIMALCSELAIHICAAAPLFIDRESVDSDYLKNHEEIFREQSEKVDNISEETKKKITEGKLNKHISAVCLIEQNFVKDNSLSIRELIGETEQETGYNLSVKDFIRLEV